MFDIILSRRMVRRGNGDRVSVEVEQRVEHPDVVARRRAKEVGRALAADIPGVRVASSTGGFLTLEPGRPVALHGEPGSGCTRIGLSLLAETARQAPVVAVDVRGWISPLAAWDAGIPPGRFVVVRADHTTWSGVVGSLMDGIRAAYVEVPAGTPDTVLRRIVATARAKRVGLALRPLRGRIPAGLAHLALDVQGVEWVDPPEGHGHLRTRTVRAHASGKGVSGIERVIEVEDNGTDAVRVVAGLAAAPARRSAG
ncbi:MAG: hypothetical protein HKN46_06610 [Acidimicrobiia bacterium]|nr:hypothetical protein [Acidimicrobiia bacterium]